ncbi:MAG: hypothetical protein RLZZ347_701 [Candidatus Parcubacteria bacterium]|jgi:hypothetical protein
MLTAKQINAIQQIATFYDDFDVAREILNQAVKNKHRYFSGEVMTLHFLANEKALHAKRKMHGVKSPENILRNTLDLLPSTVPSGVGSQGYGFNLIRWQETHGPWG